MPTLFESARNTINNNKLTIAAAALMLLATQLPGADAYPPELQYFAEQYCLGSLGLNGLTRATMTGTQQGAFNHCLATTPLRTVMAAFGM